jgi:hypothetical protein
MKNLAIERPTTLIKITKSDFEKDSLDESINKNLNYSSIDFYNLEDENDFEPNFDDSKMFNKMSTKDTEHYNITANMYLYEKSEIIKDERYPFKLVSNQFTKKNLIETKNGCLRRFFNDPSSKIKSSKIDNLFVISTLRFDLRVKSYVILDESILVYFLSENDSLSFYKQYYNFLELSFLQSCNWSPVLTPCLISNTNIIYSQEENQIDVELKNNIQQEIVYERKRFVEMVDHFNQLKSEFAKSELIKMAEDLSKGKTAFVFNNTKELAVGSKSNKIMQDAIKIMSGEEIDRIYECLEYDVVPISATKHGAYTVQTLLNYSTNASHRKMISKYFAKEGEFLLAHEIGNYTFQKLLSFDVDLVSSFFVSNFDDVVEHDLGLKVFRRCSEYLNKYKDILLDKLNSYATLPSGMVIQLRQIIINL